MIYLESIDSIIECMYLSESINNTSGFCNIFVNPNSIKYLIGKTIILNKPYSTEKIKELLGNGCKVISRIYVPNPMVEVAPYILKANFDVMWNGRIVSEYSYSDLGSLFSSGECDFDIDNYRLYFPKLLSPKREDTLDEYGNLTGLGWVLQQVGINIKSDTPFTNLDVLKTGKIIL